MANLGKCMLFYLKYAAEMERLYEAEERKVEGLPNPDRVLEKIKLVGDTAKREGAELLETCAPRIDEHFRAISVVQRIRNNLEKTWNLSFKVAPRKATDRHFWIGVYIDRNRAALIPWVWCRASRRAEDDVVRILGRGLKLATFPDWDSGSVGLTEIKIPISGTTGRGYRVRFIGRSGPAGLRIVHGAGCRGDGRDCKQSWRSMTSVVSLMALLGSRRYTGTKLMVLGAGSSRSSAMSTDFP